MEKNFYGPTRWLMFLIALFSLLVGWSAAHATEGLNADCSDLSSQQLQLIQDYLQQLRANSSLSQNDINSEVLFYQHVPAMVLRALGQNLGLAAEDLLECVPELQRPNQYQLRLIGEGDNHPCYQDLARLCDPRDIQLQLFSSHFVANLQTLGSIYELLNQQQTSIQDSYECLLDNMSDLESFCRKSLFGYSVTRHGQLIE